MTAQLDLFGNEIDNFKNAKERYGVWPVTVWDCDFSDPVTRDLKKLIGDSAQNRAGCAQRGTGKLNYTAGRNPPGQSKRSTRAGCFQSESVHDSESCYKVDSSVFNPAVASWILNCFAPAEGVCFDPFGGGGTRAIMAAKHGLRYVGMELRQDEVEAVMERCDAAGVRESVTIHTGDARNCSQVEDGTGDFLITCPPYWNLEKYDGGDADLSEIDDYDSFNAELSKVVRETWRVLKPGALAVWVVGLHRDGKGNLCAMNHDVAKMHQEAGFWFKEEIVLAHRNNGAIQRVGNFEKGNKFLIRTHEYALVFVRLASAPKPKREPRAQRKPAAAVAEKPAAPPDPEPEEAVECEKPAADVVREIEPPVSVEAAAPKPERKKREITPPDYEPLFLRADGGRPANVPAPKPEPRRQEPEPSAPVETTPCRCVPEPEPQAPFCLPDAAAIRVRLRVVAPPDESTARRKRARDVFG